MTKIKKQDLSAKHGPNGAPLTPFEAAHYFPPLMSNPSPFSGGRLPRRCAVLVDNGQFKIWLHGVYPSRNGTDYFGLIRDPLPFNADTWSKGDMLGFDIGHVLDIAKGDS